MSYLFDSASAKVLQACQNLREAVHRTYVDLFKTSDHSSPECYSYRRLNPHRKEVRLLLLEPGTDLDPISCRLKHEFLDGPSPPLYDTISYACGESSQKATIWLHGSEVEVLATSEAALRCMRYNDRPRTLWIDSICIDQGNAKEKGHQIEMMYEIYTHTSHNLVYLGPDDGNMRNVVKSVADLCHEISYETRDFVDLKQALFGPLGQIRYSRFPFTIDIVQSGLMQFFENPWFKRLWVVQEAALSRSSTCYVGHNQLPLNHVLRAAAWLIHKWPNLPDWSLAQCTGINNAAVMFYLSDKDHGRGVPLNDTLWTLLLYCDDFNTHERKDRVFAVMGLWRKQTKAMFLPPGLRGKYMLKSHEVFTNACKFAIKESRGLSVLRSVSANPEGKDFEWWPSWVPVLDRKSSDCRHHTGRLSFDFDASNGEPTGPYSCKDGSKTLDVAGVLIGKVTHATSTPTQPYTASEFGTIMASAEGLIRDPDWMEDVRGYVEITPDDVLTGGGEATEKRAALVLSAGSYREGERYSEQKALRGYRGFKGDLRNHTVPQRQSELEIITSRAVGGSAARYHRALCYALPHRAVFHTQEGYVGLGPACTRPGDIVAILYGCRWPVVLMPLSTPGEYTFLECSYVYGIMDGEAVRKHKELGLADDRFLIV